MPGVEGDADTRGDADLVAAEDEGGVELRQQLPDNRLDLRHLAGTVEQDGELIAAYARQGIRGAHVLGQAP